VLSDGTPWRPLIHVEDMARAIYWALLRTDESHFLPLNIGSDEWTFQIRDLATSVQELIPSAEVRINHAVASDNRSYKVDFSKFQAMAPDHQPQITLKHAVKGLQEQILGVGEGLGLDFREALPYMRLKTLENHIKVGRMSRELHWTNSRK